ncbi:hypothetical protein [Kitasatospora sp. KL5]|uniref:hypothetical protein n=1 Tax=Kitasatospora sp. KL5 TaxID=3425125 RepID=UPI003D701E9C
MDTELRVTPCPAPPGVRMPAVADQKEALGSAPAPDTPVVDCPALAAPTSRMRRLLRVTEADTVPGIGPAEQPPVKDGC